MLGNPSVVLVTLDPYQFPRWWQHSQAIWPLSDNCLETRIFPEPVLGPESGRWSPLGVSFFTHPSPGQGRDRREGWMPACPQGYAGALQKPWFPFHSQSSGQGFPQHGHGATNRGRKAPGRHSPRAWSLPCTKSHFCSSRWECARALCLP